ncbi:MAG: hypothetical protein CVV15_00355 [Gammaproteobacteria bacterium HGW-Gammaproteobacteria-5]|nr:MAG: hypothetical protein CVV15_00355 [Gammaproteobacteria bacterium HGW-Gammaproteobacteria-5]
MSKPTIIKFKKPWQGYGPNEVAGFAKEKADQLIEAGVAEAYAKGKGAPAAQPAAPKSGAAGAANTGDNTAENKTGDNDTVDEDKKP